MDGQNHSDHDISHYSFNFRSTNAHAILEEYNRSDSGIIATPNLFFTPLTFLAASETALKLTLSQHLDYLKANLTVNLANLAYTLQHRRSTLAYRKAVAAMTIQKAILSLKSVSSGNSNNSSKPDTSFSTQHAAGTSETPGYLQRAGRSVAADGRDAYRVVFLCCIPHR